MEPRSGRGRPQRAELLAALSLAIDLGLGQPLEHMLRSTLIAMRLADLVEADPLDRATAYYGGLIAWIGCHADSEEFSELFGDDIAFRAASYSVDWRGPRFAALLVRSVGSARPLQAHLTRLGSFALHAQAQLAALIGSHCVSAAALAGRLGLPEPVARGLTYTFERWDGSGLPTGAAGNAIPLGMRMVHIADVVEVHLRLGGADAARTVLHDRRGTQFDPDLVGVLLGHLEDLVPSADEAVWERALALAPDGDRLLDDAETDSMLTAVGDFVDLKSPWTVGHSRAVADLAAGAGTALGLPSAEVAALARGGHVLDLGLMGVPNRVWRTVPRSPADQERVRMHPYLTSRILARVGALRGIASLAGAHHERLDGSGFPAGATAQELDLPQRVLAAADRYQSLLEGDPLRPASSPSDAGGALRDEVRAGALDGPAADAVLAATGEHRPARGSWPAGLTDREVEVLRLLAHGRSAPEVGAELHIAPKTARNHIEHIYLKIGSSNRTGAAMFALAHGLVGTLQG